MQRVIAVAVILAVLVGPMRAHAQGIPVFDIQLIAHYARLIITTNATYQKLMEQYETITRMSHGLPGMDTFKVPAIVTPGHNTGRYLEAAPLLETLNSGDPRATKYYAVVRALSREVGIFDSLPPEVRQALRAAYATVEVFDSTSHQAANQVGATRVYNHTIGEQINHLDSIITSPDPAFHQMTSVLDTIAASELVAARTNEAATQIEAHLVAQQIAKAKATRDAYAGHVLMVMNRLRDRGKTARALIQGQVPVNGGQP